MAESLKVTDRVSNTTTSRNYGAGSYTVTRSGAAEHSGRIDLGTSEETITVDTDIGNLGVVLFLNHDDTNFCEVGISTGVYCSQVPPGQSIRLYGPLTQATWYVKADTAACDFEFNFWEA